MRSYDLAIIGSGPGGYVSGLYASRHKLKVCLIEKDLVGGTCLNRGCIPTKVMLNSASLFSRIKDYTALGINIDGYSLNFPAVVLRKNNIVEKLRAGIETLLRANHIDLIRGEASFSEPDVITAGSGDPITAKNIIIATGSRPMELPNLKCDESTIYSSDGILNIPELPGSIIIIGGGVIGAEFATMFSRFGVKVTVVELMDRLIPTQSREVSKKLEMVFRKSGIDVMTSTKVESLTADGSARVRISTGKEITGDKVLIGVGRRSNIEGLGLEKIGVSVEKGRITVDKRLRTSIKNIYAIGDCVSGPLLAYKASYDGIVACDNILGGEREADYSNMPNCIFTDPEIGSVGLTEEEARQRYPDARIAKFPYLASSKAAIIGRQEGFVKIIGDAKGSLLGVEYFGEGASDLISEAVLARQAGVGIKELSRVIHGHPTLSEILQEAAHIFCGTPIHTL